MASLFYAFGWSRRRLFDFAADAQRNNRVASAANRPLRVLAVLKPFERPTARKIDSNRTPLPHERFA